MQAAMVELDLLETGILRNIIRFKKLGDSLKERATNVLAASEGPNNRQIVREHSLEEHRGNQWRTRWHKFHELWKQLDPALRPTPKVAVKKPEITEEQRALILAVSCEPPGESGW